MFSPAAAAGRSAAARRSPDPPPFSLQPPFQPETLAVGVSRWAAIDNPAGNRSVLRPPAAPNCLAERNTGCSRYGCQLRTHMRLTILDERQDFTRQTHAYAEYRAFAGLADREAPIEDVTVTLARRGAAAD